MDTMIFLEVITGLTMYAIATVSEKYVKTYNAEVWEMMNEED